MQAARGRRSWPSGQPTRHAGSPDSPLLHDARWARRRSRRSSRPPGSSLALATDIQGARPWQGRQPLVREVRTSWPRGSWPGPSGGRRRRSSGRRRAVRALPPEAAGAGARARPAAWRAHRRRRGPARRRWAASRPGSPRRAAPLPSVGRAPGRCRSGVTPVRFVHRFARSVAHPRERVWQRARGAYVLECWDAALSAGPARGPGSHVVADHAAGRTVGYVLRPPSVALPQRCAVLSAARVSIVR